MSNYFPDPRNAPSDSPLAYGGDLSVDRLLAAYENGIFPWYSLGEPIYWWCPDPRFVLFPDDMHIGHGLRKTMRDSEWEITFDRDFPSVIRHCASSPRKEEGGTWITAEMLEAYTKLHNLGYAHSVECWKDEELVGGLYGVSLGSAFFGESMFFTVPNASKVAFAHCVEQLIRWNFNLIDCQMPTTHLAQFGAKSIPREQFLDLLGVSLKAPTKQGAWEFDKPSTV